MVSRKFKHYQKGATLVEYAMLISLLVAVSIVSLGAMGVNIRSMFNGVSNNMNHVDIYNIAVGVDAGAGNGNGTVTVTFDVADGLALGGMSLAEIETPRTAKTQVSAVCKHPGGGRGEASEVQQLEAGGSGTIDVDVSATLDGYFCTINNTEAGEDSIYGDEAEESTGGGSSGEGEGGGGGEIELPASFNFNFPYNTPLNGLVVDAGTWYDPDDAYIIDSNSVRNVDSKSYAYIALEEAPLDGFSIDLYKTSYGSSGYFLLASSVNSAGSPATSSYIQWRMKSSELQMRYRTGGTTSGYSYPGCTYPNSTGYSSRWYVLDITFTGTTMDVVVKTKNNGNTVATCSATVPINAGLDTLVIRAANYGYSLGDFESK